MAHIKSFISILEQKFDLSAEAKKAFVEALSFRKFKKKELLFSSGQVSSQIYFIISGCVTEFFVSPKNEEISVWFGFENDFAVPLSSFISQSPSITSIVAMEPTSVIEINRNKLYELYDDFHEIERIGRQITEQYFLETELYHYEFHHLQAQQRFENLLKAKPHTFNRIPLSMIASYLGISNETLSRLRAKRL